MANSPGAPHTRKRVGSATRPWAVLALLLLTACGRPPERVVLITIDTLRADHVGAYGGPAGLTPVLDHLAAEGVRFETAVAPTPLTLPSHASLLTGLSPLEHGVHHNSTFRLRDDVPTLAERMRAAGFATAAFLGAHVLDSRFGLARGFDVYDDRMRGRHAAGDSGWAERPADQVVDAVLAWLDSAPPRFFLWVHLYDPHAFYLPPPRFREGFPSAYAGEIAFADSQVGRLLRTIGERFALPESLVAVTSDHGESLGQHGESTHGLAIYDATQHVPLIFAGRGVPRGGVVSTPVRLVDVAPTLLSLAGVAPLPEAVGRDLTAWLRGEGEPLPPAYVETFATRLDLGMSPLIGLRTERYKYIRAPRPELYDVAADPDEARDLAAEQPEVVARLEAALARRIAGAPPVRPNLELDDEQRALLESLGYVVAEAPPQPIAVDSRDGPDPKDALQAFERFHDAALLMQAGQPEAARRLLDGVEGGGFYAEAARAEAALGAGDAAQAEHQARAAIALQPQRSYGWFLLGRSLFAQDRLDEAGRAYRSALARDPESGRLYELLARVAERQGDVERAIDLYERAATARDPQPPALERAAELRRAPR